MSPLNVNTAGTIPTTQCLQMTDIFLSVARHVHLFPLIMVYSCPSCLLKRPLTVLKFHLIIFLSSILHFIAFINTSLNKREQANRVNFSLDQTIASLSCHKTCSSQTSNHTALQSLLKKKDNFRIPAALA